MLEYVPRKVIPEAKELMAEKSHTSASSALKNSLFIGINLRMYGLVGDYPHTHDHKTWEQEKTAEIYSTSIYSIFVRRKEKDVEMK